MRHIWILMFFAVGEAVARVQCDIPGELSAGVVGLAGVRAEDQEQVHEQWQTGTLLS